MNSDRDKDLSRERLEAATALVGVRLVGLFAGQVLEIVAKHRGQPSFAGVARPPLLGESWINHRRCRRCARRGHRAQGDGRGQGTTPVSYTHLTLPTTTLCRSR